MNASADLVFRIATALIIAAWIITRLIVLLPTIQSFLSPVYTPEVFLRGLAVGVGVALLGALYPAYRAATYSPAQAIRYE